MLKWTTELPKEPGWYFYQRIDFTGYPVRVGFIKNVLYYQGNYLTLCKNSDTDVGFVLKDLTVKHRWAGPIEEPEDSND